MGLLWGAVSAASAQTITPPEGPDTTDVQLWTSFRLDWRPVKSVELEFQEQIRFKNNWGTFDRQFHQLTVLWSPRWNAVSKAQSLAVSARVKTRLDDQGGKQGLERFFRWHVQHAAKVEFGRWAMASRVRFQERSALWLMDGEDPSEAPVKAAWRLKARLDYNFKGWKLDPHVSLERFLEVVPEGWPADGAWRARIGTDFKPAKRQRIKVVVQREWRGKYTPSGVGATLDDFRLYGDNEWALVVGWRCRLKSEKKG